MHEGDSSATKRSMTDVGVKHCTIFIIVADESIRSHPCYLSLHAFYWLVMLSLKLTLIWIHWWHYFFFKLFINIQVIVDIYCFPAVQVFYDWLKKLMILMCFYGIIWVLAILTVDLIDFWLDLKLFFLLLLFQ